MGVGGYRGLGNETWERRGPAIFFGISVQGFACIVVQKAKVAVPRSLVCNASNALEAPPGVTSEIVRLLRCISFSYSEPARPDREDVQARLR